jgi:hypothetical protein
VPVPDEETQRPIRALEWLRLPRYARQYRLRVYRVALAALADARRNALSAPGADWTSAAEASAVEYEAEVHRLARDVAPWWRR